VSALRGRGFEHAKKIRLVGELEPVLRESRSAGQKVVFTNGCFDLVHPGHRHLLEGAAREGDILVVAVNSDESVRRLKGPGRPRLPLEDRLVRIAALECVDHVIPFEEDTPLRILEALRPDVLVKGEEYRSGVVVGRELVEGYGGRVALLPMLPRFSTTGLLGDSATPSGGGPES